jgi:hypothetical protein
VATKKGKTTKKKFFPLPPFLFLLDPGKRQTGYRLREKHLESETLHSPYFFFKLLKINFLLQKTSSLTTGGSAVKVEAAGDGPKSNQVRSPRRWDKKNET